MSKIPTLQFLKDVLICSLGAFGGPEAHYGVFLDQMVQKKKYVTEEEMIELIALCGVLPGPSSTQTMVSIGYKVGGMKLAWLTLLVWALPAMAMMTLFLICVSTV
jgi:chromate transporter